MTRFISLLRGINVSGQKKIKMGDLKCLYEDIGCKNIVTYIQSGNVIFDHPSNDQTAPKNQIESAIENKYNFEVYVDVMGKEDINTALENIPFKDIDLERDGSKILVTFLEDSPAQERQSFLMKYVREPEVLIFMGKVIYLHCPDGVGKSKLTNALFENKLKMRATTRNLRTVTKLAELAQEN